HIIVLSLVSKNQIAFPVTKVHFLCSNPVKTIFSYWIGTVFSLILQSASQKIKKIRIKLLSSLKAKLSSLFSS
ncbi:hypothetical protein BTH90_07910, partial [Lactobacillus delbrueckii subsp. bulgaricus]|nr:hypothetical protein [Lactobacillus delbrueckii subsp. bulgaricus]